MSKEIEDKKCIRVGGGYPPYCAYYCNVYCLATPIQYQHCKEISYNPYVW